MSLFGTIGMASNTLKANQVALQVIGQNIANANTPGYIREDVVLATAGTQKSGDLLLGLGVQVEAIIQKIDNFLEERLRGSVSDVMDAGARESGYMQLEQILGELTDTDLSTSINSFFSAVEEILNQPEDISVRNLAVLQGERLAGDIQRLASRVNRARNDINGQVIDSADKINRLIEEITGLNVKIAEAEGSDTSASDAVGLRDQRLRALEDLAGLVDISVKEQPNGGVVIYSGGDLLVFQGMARKVEVALEGEQGMAAAYLQVAETEARLNVQSGEVAGLMAARDEVMGGFLDRLDQFAETLVFEFNKLYSQGQGLNGFREIISEYAVDDHDLALNEAGLRFTPVNGSFQVLVYNKQLDITQTTDVTVDLNGLGHDTTMADLAGALDAVDGISAVALPSGELQITSDSAAHEFGFANDTSGLLAALGINTFFRGWTALGMGVDTQVKEDPSKFAASRGGIGADTANAVELAAFNERPLDSHSGSSLAVLYDRLTGETTQAAAVSRAVANGARVFEATLRGQKLAQSGVSLDEEAIRMITFQRAFQANAKLIETLSELLDLLTTL